MSAPPRVSVLLANWNGGRFLSQAVESVVCQTYADWELVAVDTGSTDGSREILESWARRDERVQPLLLPERLPCPTALNLGLARIRSPLVARIESDDVWLPERLAKQVEFMETDPAGDVGVCGSDALLLDEAGSLLGVKRYPRSHAECRRAFWFRNPFCHSAVLIRREALAECGGYDAAFSLAEDLELWFRIGQRWALRNWPEPLVGYRLWSGSLTTRRLRRLAWVSLRVRLRAARQAPGEMPPLAALYSAAALAAGLLPPLAARRLFEWGLRRFDGTAGAVTMPPPAPVDIGPVHAEHS